jgi:hypothetical protein
MIRYDMIMIFLILLYILMNNKEIKEQTGSNKIKYYFLYSS